MGIVTYRFDSVLKGGLSVENRAGEFTVLMDEPETLRGTDTGMNTLRCFCAACGPASVSRHDCLPGQ